MSLKNQRDKAIRSLLKYKACKWLLDNGWVTNELHGKDERWRRRSFDRHSMWVTFAQAIKAQLKWNNFWD